MTQHIGLFVGLCRKELEKPYIPSALVACEIRGCGHLVWCDANLQPAWSALQVVCAHCVDGVLPKAAS